MESNKEIMFEHLDFIGWVHFIASISSLITGTFILLRTKGDLLHKRVGYTYVISMVIVLATAFMIYDLFGGFGIFHGFAIVSIIALVGGMEPMLNPKRRPDYLEQHLRIMSWSVIGLYCAFISETITRLFRHLPYAFPLLGILCGLTCFIGAILINRTLKKFKVVEK